MTDATKGADDAASADTERSSDTERTSSRRARGAGVAKVKEGARTVRNKIATLVWLIAVVCALFLAVGALLIALEANPANPVVEFITSTADRLDLWFSRENGIFTFPDTADGRVKSALTNWGIAAVVYLVVGKILDRIIRP
jgi:hypothetical protein